jgi:hypothetical protein
MVVITLLARDKKRKKKTGKRIIAMIIVKDIAFRLL